MRRMITGALAASLILVAGLFVACDGDTLTQASSDGLMPLTLGPPTPCPDSFGPVAVSIGSGADRNLNALVCRIGTAGGWVEVDDAAEGSDLRSRKKA